MKYEITFEENPTDEELHILVEGLVQYTQLQTQLEIGSGGNKPLSFFLRDEEGLIVGGVHGNLRQVWLAVYQSALGIRAGQGQGLRNSAHEAY